VQVLYIFLFFIYIILGVVIFVPCLELFLRTSAKSLGLGWILC